MVNFLFHCADGSWLIECVDTSDWRSEMEEDETEGDWISHKVVEHIDTRWLAQRWSTRSSPTRPAAARRRGGF